MIRLIRVCCLLSMALCAAEIVAVGIARFTYYDPFAPYMAIMPGQSIDALKNYPCQLELTIERSTALFSCQVNPSFGIFRKFTLTSLNRVITRMTIFEIQPDALHLGDLIACWHQPLILMDHYADGTQSSDAYWENQMRAQLSSDEDAMHPNAFSSVRYLLLYRQWKPYGSCS
ncbi:MAG TPA: hypothetical protein VHD90_08795 [Phototrophicaceae bacterium]|nr:hypothetical protein [Phototrophicaceae bacterium]